MKNQSSVQGRIVSAKSYARKQTEAQVTAGEPVRRNFVLAVRDSEAKKINKIHVSAKVLANELFNDSTHAVSTKDVINMDFYAEYHQKGDILSDETEVTEGNVLVDNNSICIFSDETAIIADPES